MHTICNSCVPTHPQPKLHPDKTTERSQLQDTHTHQRSNISWTPLFQRTQNERAQQTTAKCKLRSTQHKEQATLKSDGIQIDTTTPRNDHADSKSNVRRHRNSHARKNKIKHSKLCLACHWNTHARARCQLHLLCSTAQRLRRKLFKDAKRQQLRILP